MKSTRFSSLALIGSVVFLLMGCDNASNSPAASDVTTAASRQSHSHHANRDSAGGNSELNIVQVAGYQTATSFEELGQKSRIVVVGVPTGRVETREVHGQHPDDPTKEDPNYISIVKIYEVAISELWKGTASERINVIQFQEVLVNPGDGFLRVKESDADYPLEEGQRYVLFLRPHARIQGVWIQTVYPGHFEVTNGMVEPYSPWHMASEFFPRTPEETLRSLVAAVSEATPVKTDGS
jgi:hypothetical protein